ncbi:MAG TPA: hemolysin family protein [Acidimicrobiales bacterium]|nr:hemolysin family protein [Acidimicrobiales bacterium]
MGDVLPQLGLVATLVLLNAAFAGTELALISLREGQLQRLEQAGGTGRVLADLARDPNRFLATIQIGITLAGFLASAAAAVSLADPLTGPLGFLGRAARPVAVVAVTMVLTFFTLVLGELAPKRIAMQRAERWGLIAARPIAALARLARPVVWLLSASSDLVVRLAGTDPTERRGEVSEAELRELVVTQEAFTPEQRMIIAGTFEAGERLLRNILVPRRDITWLDADLPAKDGLRRLVDSGHTRAPVARGDLDDVVGIVNIRYLIDGGGVVADHARDAMVQPETMHLLDALREMQHGRQQMAIVVDEYGGVAGIVTVEDLVEELVGEIWDETDPDVVAIEHRPDGSIVIPGSFPAHDLGDLGIEVEAGDYSTIAGLVLERLGRIPEAPGDRVDLDDWVAEVVALEGRAITGVRLYRRRR